MIGRCSTMCDVILLLSLTSLGTVFLTRYAEVASRNSPSEFPAAEMTSSDEELDGKSPPSGPSGPGTGTSVSQQTVDDVLRRVPDTRPAACHSRKYQHLPVATIVVVFNDYEFYDAKLTLASILRDAELSHLVTEILLVDDASSREQVLQDTQNYLRSVSKSLPVVRLVRLARRMGRVEARSLAVAQHVTNDVVVCVDAGVVCVPGWLSPLLDLVSSASDGQTTVAVPHYDHLSHPITLEYEETHSDLVAALSWSLTIRMRRQLITQDTDDDGALWRTVPVLRGEVFAVRRSFLSSIGGLYDSRLEFGTGAGEHIDLSLRTWLCGGSIKVRALLFHFSFQSQLSFLLALINVLNHIAAMVL